MLVVEVVVLGFWTLRGSGKGGYGAGRKREGSEEESYRKRRQQLWVG